MEYKELIASATTPGPLSLSGSGFGAASSLEEQMLDALEIFKYSFSFRNSLFVILLQDKKSLKRLINDFQVIQSSRIFLVVLVPSFDGLGAEIQRYRSTGIPLEYFSHEPGEDISGNRMKTIRKEFSSNEVVVIGLTHHQEHHSELKYLHAGFDIANSHNAKKFFYVHSEGILAKNGQAISHISLLDLKKLAEERAGSFNIPDEVITGLITNIQQTRREFVIIDDAPGALYQEIFTHQGRGTLITDEYPNNIRHGRPEDVFMVRRMMKPYISAGVLLPVSEEEISSQIQDFLLYTINDSIVAGARMKEYGSGVELAKFFCLPRFRRRGHARTLAQKFIDTAREMKKEYIFSLSITPGMWDFLKSLGFHETERESLPDAWKANYNFQRKSKAFLLSLT
jgi:N-acetylglutamate synthase-like GNAT family acetyltransferase